MSAPCPPVCARFNRKGSIKNALRRVRPYVRACPPGHRPAAPFRGANPVDDACCNSRCAFAGRTSPDIRRTRFCPPGHPVNQRNKWFSNPAHDAFSRAGSADCDSRLPAAWRGLPAKENHGDSYAPAQLPNGRPPGRQKKTAPSGDGAVVDTGCDLAHAPRRRRHIRPPKASRLSVAVAGSGTPEVGAPKTSNSRTTPISPV
jgi:hypothetical protein